MESPLIVNSTSSTESVNTSSSASQLPLATRLIASPSVRRGISGTSSSSDSKSPKKSGGKLRREQQQEVAVRREGQDGRARESLLFLIDDQLPRADQLVLGANGRTGQQGGEKIAIIQSLLMSLLPVRFPQSARQRAAPQGPRCYREALIARKPFPPKAGRCAPSPTARPPGARRR